MKIHEFQAKELFKQFSIPVPNGVVAQIRERSPTSGRKPDPRANSPSRRKSTRAVAAKAAASRWWITPAEAAATAETMLGKPLVTPQTGPEGQIVRKVLIEEGQDINKEFYAGLTLDRGLAKPVFMVSPAGGMDIEEVAEKTPEKIIKGTRRSRPGTAALSGTQAGQFLGLSGAQLRQAAALFASLFRLFNSLDASLVEINPLILTGDNGLLALDAKNQL